MHCVLIIVMERRLTLTLTSNHINNARNEFLRSDLYGKMILRLNLALLLKSYDLLSTGVAILDFDELQEFPKMSSWVTLLKCTLDQQFMEHLKLCRMQHHRKPHIHGLNKHEGDI